MLTELKKVIGACEGLMLVEHESCGEPSLITMHYVSEFTSQKANVVYVSLNQSEEMLRQEIHYVCINIYKILERYVGN